MPVRYAANISLLWPELPYLQRFAAAAEAGFEAVEVLFPYDLPVEDTLAALRANGLEFVLLNAPRQNRTGRERGFAAVPSLRAAFQRDMHVAFEYAAHLGARFLHVMSGPGEGYHARQAFVDNLSWAAERAPEGLTLTVEPLNRIGMPGYFMCDYELAADVIAAVARPNVALQYDCFHAQVIHGDALAVFDRHRPMIRHIQIGDAPNRTAPGTGEVDFPGLFERIQHSEFNGWVSAEYHPGGRTETTLGWMSEGAFKGRS